jgi:hypothetical protein
MKTQKVRIAVGIDPRDPSRWASAGWTGATEQELINYCWEVLDDVPQPKFCWVEVEIPVPDEPYPIIEGRVFGDV